MGTLEHLLDFSYDELERFCLETLGEKRYRARQIFDWLYRRNVAGIDEMTNLSADLRSRLTQAATLTPLRLTEAIRDEDGTTKLQFTLDDGAAVESVIIPSDDHLTLCVSTQVGCAMNCAFCYTASLGFSRNLACREIVDQYRQAVRHLGPDGGSFIRNVVLMGMGEPLLNCDNVVKAVNLLMDERGFNLSSRRVTVSTSGVVPKIAELLERSGVSLAVSLNATSDEVRSRLMPVNRRWPLPELLAALERVDKPRRKRIVLEYVLLAGINDTPADAKRLVKITRRVGGKVNLIPHNPHPKSAFLPPSDAEVLAFQKILLDAGVAALIRQPKGRRIAGACGMLGRGTIRPDPDPDGPPA